MQTRSAADLVNFRLDVLDSSRAERINTISKKHEKCTNYMCTATHYCWFILPTLTNKRPSLMTSEKFRCRGVEVKRLLRESVRQWLLVRAWDGIKKIKQNSKGHQNSTRGNHICFLGSLSSHSEIRQSNYHKFNSPNDTWSEMYAIQHYFPNY